MLAVITALSTLLIISCGGGGGGDSVPVRDLQPISYTGNTAPVAITLTNTPTLVTNVLFGGSTASDLPSAVTITETNTLPGEFLSSPDRYMDVFDFSLDNIIGNATHGFKIPAGVDVNETNSCESGYYTVQGSLSDITATGTLTFDYYNCLDDGVTLDGMLHFHVHYMDYYHMNSTMEFVLMTISCLEFNASLSGTMQMDDSISGNSLIQKSTMNYVEKDNNTGKLYQYENYVMTTVIDDIYSYYSGGSINYSGAPVAIMYDSLHGSLAVESITPFLFSSTTRSYPDLGGQLVLTGNQTGIQLSVESSRHTKLELDLGYEVVRYVLWSELDKHTTLNLADSDGDGMHDSWEESFGLDPNINDAAGNLDNDALTNLEEYEQGYDPNNPLSPAP